MTALIIGATGATGKDLVNILLQKDAFDEVRAFVRHENKCTPDPKLKTHIVDFEAPDTWKHLLKGGDVAFSCLGTTRKDAGAKEYQRRVDKEYQLTFASNAYDEGVKQFVLISSRGASAVSPFFYPRIKGELDDAVREIPFRRTFILRPNSLIRKGTSRKSELFAISFLQKANTWGVFTNYRPISTEMLAEKMIQLAISVLPDGIHILKGNQCEK